MIWREKQLLLVVLAILLIANLIYFFTYRVQFEARLEEYAGRAGQSQARLEQAKASRVAAERQLASYRKVEHDIQDVYVNRWSTEAARLASLIEEVKRLAVVSQLIPQTYSFAHVAGTPEATSVGITFAVQGTYQQVRRLINLLELSQQFVIVDQITLSGRGGDEALTLNLHVKTLFRNMQPPAAPRPPNRTS
jgi:Tfp pilus assembly protein PilO